MVRIAFTYIDRLDSLCANTPLSEQVLQHFDERRDWRGWGAVAAPLVGN